MNRKFKQKKIHFDNSSNGILSVKKLCSLIESHPNKQLIYDRFSIDKIKGDYISMENIDIVFQKVKYYLDNYNRYQILAETKNVDVFDGPSLDGKDLSVFFNFEEYVDIDEIKKNLKAEAIYESKNKFFDEFEMTKYANNLFKIGHGELAQYNVRFFKKRAADIDSYNNEKSYRMVEHEGISYVRGVTSTRYYEYGIDFTFVVGMLVLYTNMKENPGTEYKLVSGALSESKLELIASEKQPKDAGSFGQVTTAIKITTNDLGTGSLNFVNVINVMQKDSNGFYLIPRKGSIFENSSLIINHNTKPENVFKSLGEIGKTINTTDSFIEELIDIKSIKSPDELRVKILSKLQNPRSNFKSIIGLSDIFKRKIDNEITNFSKLLEMCNKAEELELDHDLKDKLRYIISDVILYGNNRDN